MALIQNRLNNWAFTGAVAERSSGNSVVHKVELASDDADALEDAAQKKLELGFDVVKSKRGYVCIKRLNQNHATAA
jgi:hypothetical protein